MLFNTSDKLSYSEIMTQSNLSDDDLPRLLHSLSCGKYKILSKEPNTKTVNQNDYFEFNHKFNDRMRRIKVWYSLNTLYCQLYFDVLLSTACEIGHWHYCLFTFGVGVYTLDIKYLKWCNLGSSSTCWWKKEGCWRCRQRQTVCYWCCNCAHHEESESVGSSTACLGVCWAVESNVQGMAYNSLQIYQMKFRETDKYNGRIWDLCLILWLVSRLCYSPVGPVRGLLSRKSCFLVLR